MYVATYDIEMTDIHRLTPEYYDDHIGNQTHYKGDLNLMYTKITSLGKLEHVGGWIDLDNTTHLKSLGKLEHASTSIFMRRTNVTSLGNLKSVGFNLDLRRTNLTDLGKLEQVGGSIFCTRDSDTHKLLINSKFVDRVASYLNPS